MEKLFISALINRTLIFFFFFLDLQHNYIIILYCRIIIIISYNNLFISHAHGYASLGRKLIISTILHTFPRPRPPPPIM